MVAFLLEMSATTVTMFSGFVREQPPDLFQGQCLPAPLRGMVLRNTVAERQHLQNCAREREFFLHAGVHFGQSSNGTRAADS